MPIFLRSNGIEDNSKAGFVSAIILGLTNHESKLYKDTKSAIDAKNATKAKKYIDEKAHYCTVDIISFHESGMIGG